MSANTATPELTAVICTRDRPALLERALASLSIQSRPPAAILVVDNAPASDAVKDLIAERFSGVRYLRETRPGLDFARNAGLGAAESEIVAFLDDDATADRTGAAASSACSWRIRGSASAPGGSRRWPSRPKRSDCSRRTAASRAVSSGSDCRATPGDICVASGPP